MIVSDVLMELQRYGRNKSTLVNKTYIDSGEYRNKFDKITDNKDVSRVLYAKAKEMLEHRSGTLFEDMYWIDGNTGKVVAKEITSNIVRTVEYSAETKKAVASYEKNQIIAIHTHPGSMPPSVSDFNSCFSNGYRLGCVACHDGKLFVYTSAEEINERLYHMYVQASVNDGATEYDAQINALNQLKRNCKIDFWEV